MVLDSQVMRVNSETRKKLQLIKLKEGLKNVNEVIDYLIQKSKLKKEGVLRKS